MNVSATISNQIGEAKHTNTVAFCVDDNYLPYALFATEQFIRAFPTS
jgi:deoxyribose-phosphate aldolase